MADRWLVTPFSLDQPAPALLGLAASGAWVNRTALRDGPTLERLATLHAPLAAAVEATVAAGDRPVSIAGDCCAAIPVLTGLQRAGLAPRLLWLDAHGDFNTPATSPSGFLGGMPLAMLVGRGDTTLLTRPRYAAPRRVRCVAVRRPRPGSGGRTRPRRFGRAPLPLPRGGDPCVHRRPRPSTSTSMSKVLDGLLAAPDRP